MNPEIIKPRDKSEGERQIAHDITYMWNLNYDTNHGGPDDKEPAGNSGNLGLIPGLGRSPGGGHGNPLQYSCLENPMDRGTWWAAVHGVTKSQTQLSN